jgi:hypothetical protein
MRSAPKRIAATRLAPLPGKRGGLCGQTHATRPLGRHQAIRQVASQVILKSFVQIPEESVVVGWLSEVGELYRATVESVLEEATRGMAGRP